MSINAKENFVDLLEESLGGQNNFTGRVVKGLVVGMDRESVLIDVGLKSEGRVPLKEFVSKAAELKVGDTVDVFVERMEDRDGQTVLSVEKARREASWSELEKSFDKEELVNGMIFGKVKGGFVVDLDGVVAFLPGSQVDVRTVKDITPLMNVVQPFKVLKMDKLRSNIVVSRRAVLEVSRAEARSELVDKLEEGQVIKGVVKNITDYGAFIDLGGVDGLLHVTDISWRRINHPSDVLNVGDSIDVQVIRFNKETQRISLGMKQMETDPWDGAAARFEVGSRHTGKVTNVTDYGAFVELEPAVEGLIYVTELSWTKKNVHPGKVLSNSQDVEVMVLDVDMDKRRISLGLKQCHANPWQKFMDEQPVGSELEGELRNITEFGLFIGVDTEGELDGMVHLSDISWQDSGENAVKSYNKGDKVRVKVLDIDPEKERISLGIKQLSDDPFAKAIETIKKGQVVTGTIFKIFEKGIEIKLDNELLGFIRKGDLSRDREYQRPDRFAEGEKIDAKVTAIDDNTRKITLSIKAREIDEEKEVMSQYGSSDSGASLGDVLGAALESVKTTADEQPETVVEDKPKKAKKAATAKADEGESEATAEKKPKAKAAKKTSAKKDEKVDA